MGFWRNKLRYRKMSLIVYTVHSIFYLLISIVSHSFNESKYVLAMHKQNRNLTELVIRTGRKVTQNNNNIVQCARGTSISHFI